MTALQKRLLLLFALFLVLQTGVNVLKYFVEVSEGGRFGGDFVGFWLAAQRARHGDIAAIYNPDAWQSVLSAARSGPITWFVYPPFALFSLWPLGNLAYDEAVLVWSLLPLPFYFALIFFLARRSGLDRAPSRTQAYAVLGAAALPFLSANIFTGQTGAFVAIFFLGAAYFWRNRPILAGLCIGLLAVKPQMGLLLPFALAAAGQGRAIAAAAATVITLAAAATVWLGTAIWTDYVRMMQLFSRFIGRGYDGMKQLALGPYVSLHSAGMPSFIAAFLQAIITLTILAVIVRVFWRWDIRRADRNRDDGKLDLRLALLAAGTLLATPYSLSYDTPLLFLSVIPLLARAWRAGWDGVEFLSLAALLILPYAQIIMIDIHIPFGFCALSLWFWVLYRRYRREARDSAARDDFPDDKQRAPFGRQVEPSQIFAKNA